jgi:hypothetical protein
LSSAGLAIVLAAALAAPAMAQQDECDALMRQLKLDAFDQRWDAVREGSERLLAGFPACPHRAQAAFLKAQALDRTGALPEALAATTAFLDGYCRGGGAPSIDCDLARTSRLNLAGRLYRQRGASSDLAILTEGLALPGDAGIIAALTLADLPQPEARRAALPRLEKALDEKLDEDVRNRVCLALVKIEPSGARCGQQAASAAGEGPTLISVEIFDRAADRVELRINLPVALAEAVVRALPADVLAEMTEQGVDVKAIFAAVRNQTSGPIFEMVTEDQRVRIWLH